MPAMAGLDVAVRVLTNTTFNFAAQFRPRTGAQGSGRTDGVNFCRRNHAPGWLVATWKATRSASRLIGNSRSFVDGELSGSDCCACAALGEFKYAVNARLPAPSTYIVR